MRDEDMVYPVKITLQSHELHLCGFTTINEETAVLYLNKLGRGVSSIGWHRATRTEDDNLKIQINSFKK